VTLSIITINRNNAAGLEKTMQSVLSQTRSDFEYVVVDGASTDGSVAVIRRGNPESERNLSIFFISCDKESKEEDTANQSLSPIGLLFYPADEQIITQKEINGNLFP